MNLLEQQLNYPFGDELPAPGASIEVAPGVKWIRMALPFALDHINLWLMRDRIDGKDGWTIVDCCIHRDESKAQWEEIFATQLEGLPVLRVLVTHMHPDHLGLGTWLCERWNVRLWISATDYYSARLATQVATGFGGEKAANFFESHGIADADSLEKVRSRGNLYAQMVPSVPSTFHRIRNDQVIDIGGKSWRCIAGYGHSAEHIALHCEEIGVLIGGDMMLPRISTNVSVHEVEPESNALDDFLSSIDDFRELDPHTLTLPSHGKPFTGLHTRIQQLHDHHRDRLAEVLEFCEESPRTAFEILPVLFKRALDLHQTTFAMGEAVAHLHWLWYAGKLSRSKDAKGVIRFGKP